jgi:undecaprenyl-phosphate 4-deoxy-4-formamido-L-arabinose transferase
VRRLDIIIPVFNSEKTIGTLLLSILNEKKLANYELGIILVNDGSEDESLKVCESLATSYSQIMVIDLMRNYGQHSAIFAGISHSKAELLVTMDDDGQHLPRSISSLLDALTPDVDVVYGIAEKDEHSWWRNLGSRFFKGLVFRGLGIKNSSKTSAFRVIRAKVFDGIEFTGLSSGILEVAINWNTSRIKSIEVPMNIREIGKSNYSYYKLLKFAVAMLTSYSTRPLRFATLLGILGFMFSLFLTGYYMFFALRGGVKVEGFSTLVILISLLGSVQLITLGIIGEYLGKVHEKNIGKPVFVVRDVKNSRGN